MGAFYTLFTIKTNGSCLLTTLNSSPAPQEPDEEVQKTPPNSAEYLQLDKEQISTLRAEKQEKHIASFSAVKHPIPSTISRSTFEVKSGRAHAVLSVTCLNVTESDRETKSHTVSFLQWTCFRATDWDKKLAQVKISTPNLNVWACALSFRVTWQTWDFQVRAPPPVKYRYIFQNLK